MTSGDKNLKRAARVRARHLGISYTSARRQILNECERPASPMPSKSSGARVITVAHVRGGTGVSTLAAGLVDAYARAGRRVLLVDTNDVPSLRAAALLATAPPPPAMLGQAADQGPGVNGSAGWSGEVVGFVEHPGWAALAAVVPGARKDLAEVLEQAQDVFDVVVVDLSVVSSWDVHGDRVVVPLPALKVQDLEQVDSIDRRSAHLRMWDWLSIAYAALPALEDDEEAQFGARVAENRSTLSTLTDRGRDRWWQTWLPDLDGNQRGGGRLVKEGTHMGQDSTESVSPEAFLKDVASRAWERWGQVWDRHSQGWLTWRIDPAAQRDVTGFEHVRRFRTAQEATDRYQDRWNGSLFALPSTPRFVGVLTRQPELPERVRALAEQVRRELTGRGVQVAAAPLPEIQQLSEMVFHDKAVRFAQLPPQVRENLTALANELLT